MWIEDPATNKRLAIYAIVLTLLLILVTIASSWNRFEIWAILAACTIVASISMPLKDFSVPSISEITSRCLVLAIRFHNVHSFYSNRGLGYSTTNLPFSRNWSFRHNEKKYIPRG